MNSKDRDEKSLKTTAETEVILRDQDNNFSKSCLWVESGNFYGETNSDEYLILGFDTEFKTPDEALSYEEIRAGDGKYKVLSYQFHCSVYDPHQPEAKEWSGICYPDGEKRLNLTDVLLFAFAEGINSGSISKIPSTIYIAGHFTRADFPAFGDFKNITELISSVRNTFLNIGNYIPVTIRFSEIDKVDLKVILRDTMLLTPATSKSLAALGDLVGLEKLSLDPDPEKALHYKANMDALLQDNPDLFEEYAIRDAVICVRYLEQLIDQCDDILGQRKVPATLTSIGVDLLMDAWKSDLKIDPLELLGQEKLEQQYYSKKRNRFVKQTKTVNLKQVDWHVPLATECYHGGRNEQFWFGPSFEDYWTDYDLAGAYPTAMALIGKPDWHNLKVSLKVADYTPATLGMANITFKFPKSVRYPTLPVRTENGLVFPRAGECYCAAPEIALAKSLGAKIKILHGVIVPTDVETPIFGSFISDCIKKRLSYPKGSLKALFWKELSNSSYGKTAQGLRKKRVYDLRDQETKPLPPSKITNPFFAAYITSFVRSALGEIMNALPKDVCVFSCTTDGFLTNATADQIAEASKGPIADLFRKSRGALTGDPTMLEVKHQVRQLLGWRARGQATLKDGLTDQGDSVNIVLAKGGIYTPEYFDSDRVRNANIVKMFLDRKPDDEIPLNIKTGVRDIIEFDADLVEKSLSKRLNMEFDWKRKPSSVWQDKEHGHVAYSTDPWQTVEEFVRVRDYWTTYGLADPRCIKSLDDYESFAIYVLSQSTLSEADSKYLKKSRPDITRLRQMLCASWHQSKAGLCKRIDGKSAQAFADILTDAGIPCKRTDVENARKPLILNACPDTPDVREALKRLKKVFSNLDASVLLSTGKGIDLLSSSGAPMIFSPNAQ
ncbi:DNA polymerase [Qipengyuania sp. DGS5-3]|uniref:DNA polymerase n=1 Tax=Qipengyuania sp. DGS5-3 TaxID=3349632 RepID=UPI0036D20EE9